MFLTYEGIFLSEGSEGMEKGIKYNQDQSSIMLLLELNFRHNAVVLFEGDAQKHNADSLGQSTITPNAQRRACTKNHCFAKAGTKVGPDLSDSD